MFGRRRAEPRLDPVRWSRPGRGTLIRLTAVTALLTVAVASAWARTPGCGPSGDTPAAVRSPSAGPGDPGAPDRRGEGGPSPGAASAAPHALDAGEPTEPTDRWRGDGQFGGDPATARAVPPAGTLGVPVRLAEPATLSLLRPGDRVDLLSLEGTGGRTTPVADAALVLAVSGNGDPTTGGLLLALRPAEARRTVGAAERTRFAVLIRPDG